MKPRGNSEITSIIPQEPEVELSADEGQQDQPQVAEPGITEVPADGTTLETEAVQNLDSEKPVSVADSGSGEAEESQLLPSPEVPREAFELLQKVMAESEMASGVDVALEEPVHADLPAVEKAVPEEAQAGADLAKFIEAQKLSDVGGKPLFSVEEIAAIGFLGEQPDATFKLVVTLEEGYIEPVRQWAESDGLTVEEWVSRLVQQYLESWSQAPKGR
jgi:hypothetical protein